MIEILNIFYLIIVTFIIFSFPLSNVLLKKKIYKYNYNIFELYTFNLVLILNFLLVLSFLKLDTINIYFFLLSAAILNLFFFDWSQFKKLTSIIILFTIFLIAYSLNIASYPNLEWDASVNWIFKVLNFKNNYNFENLINIPGVKEYPHIGTYTWALFWRASFFDYEYTGRIFYLFVYLVGFFTLTSNLKIKNLNKIILLIIIITLAFDKILFSGYQEPLMFFLCIVFTLFAQKITPDKKYNLNYFFLILCANLILWTKNEGMFILLFLSFFILLRRKISNSFKFFLILTFITLIILKHNIFIYYFDSSFIGWSGYKFLKINELFTLEILQRLPYLLYQVLISFFKYPIYLIFIILLLTRLIKDKNFKKYLNYITFFIINIAMAVSIFYFVKDPNWKFHAQVGLDRMLYQTSGVYLIFIINFLNNFKLFNIKSNK
tara:strand:+ start:1954 stop:3258 length:1305 start_codon:yes stop_codon:yes gene_type:complete